MSKFPVVQGRKAEHPPPAKAICPWCKKRRVWEPHSMVLLYGGALASEGAWEGKKAYSGPTQGLVGFLSFVWHGAHEDGEGEFRNTGLNFSIADQVEGGVFNIAFCSIACFRAFINDSLDKFETRVRKFKPLK